jgi:hypothetical protein
MPRIPILKLRSRETPGPPLVLASSHPAISLAGLTAGVDNLRHDVYISPRVADQVRQQLARMITQNSGLERALEQEEGNPWPRRELFAGSAASAPTPRSARVEPAELKALLSDLQVAVLNRAKEANLAAIDLLGRVAIVKFLRAELADQFSQVLERCRILQKSFEGVREARALEFRERVAAFQVGKKTILRKCGQELLHLLREIEKETLSRMRRSVFSERDAPGYELFLNPLLFVEDGRDDHVNAELYVMWGNFERDPDRFSDMRRRACRFLQSLDLKGAKDDHTLDGWLNVPENAQVLVGAGNPDENTVAGRGQRRRLEQWRQQLEEDSALEYVLAAYEAAPLVTEYAPRINAQQLKNALISRDELARVETLIHQAGRTSAAGLQTARQRMAAYGNAERARLAGRFLFDLMRYHRDLRRLEALNAAADCVQLINNDRLRELSSVNGLLYQFLLPQEKTQDPENVLSHVIIKADVRDSSRITRKLMELGLNAASYFSLNFYEPVNRLLPQYGASKVFLEGDAIILALLGREGDNDFTVARACVLAREIIEIVRGYNVRLERTGLPKLEVGVGICYQDTPPLYLMDGDRPIMISDALNESDRLSSCSKSAARVIEGLEIPFNVYAFQTVPDVSAGDDQTGDDQAGGAQDFLILYNRDGIRLSAPAYARLQEEISLDLRQENVASPWKGEGARLFSGLVPVDREVFRTIVVREDRIPVVDPRDYGVRSWSARKYYEVCTNPAVYRLLEPARAAGK